MLDTRVLIYDQLDFFFYSQLKRCSLLQGGPEASNNNNNNNNKRPYHLVNLPEPGSSMTAFLNSSEIVYQVYIPLIPFSNINSKQIFVDCCFS